MTRIVLVDDQDTFLHAVQGLLAFEPDLDVVGTASNGKEALDVVAAEQPDVVVMDIQMPVLNGIAATRALKTLYPSCPILLLTTWGDEEYVREGIRAGADGYMRKDAGPANVIAAIRATAHGESVLHPTVVGKVFKLVRQAPIDLPPLIGDHLLTEREYEIVQLIAAGLSNQQIADRLGIVEPTVKSHVNHILGKLGATSRWEAVEKARRRGLL
jgi:DNA-binding NarL/FixJ family response regulator